MVFECVGTEKCEDCGCMFTFIYLQHTPTPYLVYGDPADTVKSKRSQVWTSFKLQNGVRRNVMELDDFGKGERNVEEEYEMMEMCSRSC